MDNVKEFYNTFSESQVTTGVNKRHHSILDWIIKLGIKKDASILEIGCGIGTMTVLLAKNFSGSIHATDISDKSVDIAKKSLSEFSHLTFSSVDILQITINGKFDMILLPDVLEHIPVAEHASLFIRIKGWLKDNGTVIIHIPEPHYLEWERKNNPHLLQVIDQSIYTEQLSADVARAGLHISFLQNYSIWKEDPDYQIVALKKTISREYTDLIQPVQPLPKRIINRIKRVFGS